MKLKQIIISTGAGTTFSPPTAIVPVVTESGVEEKVAAELSRGDRIFYRGQHVPVKLDEIASILYEQVEGYREARRFCYANDESGYETTRLRMDIVTALVAARPDLFEPEEAANLQDYIFRREGQDFSQGTNSRLAEYMAEVFSNRGIERSPGTYNRWLGGETIHPESLEDAIMIADELNSPAMRQRARGIRDTPKGSNPYFQLVHIHSTLMRILARPKGQGDATRSPERAQQQRQRVFQDFPSWYDPVLERLKGRIEEGIVETYVHGIEIVEKQQGSEGTGGDTETMLHKGVMEFRQEDAPETRSGTYSRLGVRAPENRGAALERKLQTMFDAYERILEIYFGNWVTGRFEENLSTMTRRIGDRTTYVPANVFTELLERHPFLGIGFPAEQPDAHQEHTQNPDRGLFELVGYSGRNWAVPEMTNLRWLSPQYGYSIKRVLDEHNAHLNLIEQLLRDRTQRRAFARELERTLPRDAAMFNALSGFYNSSVMLQCMYSQNRFIALMSDLNRAVVLETLNNSQAQSSEAKTAYMHMYRSSLKYINENLQEKFERIGRLYPGAVSELRAADAELPPELVFFRAFPHISRAVIDKRDGGPERSVLYQVAGSYGVGPETYMRMLDDAIIRGAKAFNARINELRQPTSQIMDPDYSPGTGIFTESAEGEPGQGAAPIQDAQQPQPAGNQGLVGVAKGVLARARAAGGNLLSQYRPGNH